MAKKPTIHTDIFAAYQLTNLSNEEKETIRHHIRKIMPKEFKGKKWEDIPQIDKDMFIYIDARDYLMEFVPEYCKKSVSKSITLKIKDSFLDVKKSILEHNETVSMEPYFLEGDSEEKKKEAFERYKRDYLIHFGKEADMKYEDWSNCYPQIYESKKASMSPFDLAYDANEISDDEIEYLVNPERIDFINNMVNDTILMTICQILEKKLNIIIDVKKIRECCTYIYDYMETGTHDPMLPRHMGDEDDEKYEMYHNIKKNLDFWYERRNDSKH